MYQPPKCPFSYFSKALESYLRVFFPCEYPEQKYFEGTFCAYPVTVKQKFSVNSPGNEIK